MGHTLIFVCYCRDILLFLDLGKLQITDSVFGMVTITDQYRAYW